MHLRVYGEAIGPGDAPEEFAVGEVLIDADGRITSSRRRCGH
jgi:hypothetical protein